MRDEGGDRSAEDAQRTCRFFVGRLLLGLLQTLERFRAYDANLALYESGSLSKIPTCCKF